MDVVVTVPRSFGLQAWIDEGDAAGDPPDPTINFQREWNFYLGGARPNIKRGERVYVIYNGALRGYAPLVRIDTDPYERWRFSLVRHAGAVAVTVPWEIKGFRGWRYRDWRREDEIPFPDWQDPEACIGWMRPPKKLKQPRTRQEMYQADKAWLLAQEVRAHEHVVVTAPEEGLWVIEEAGERIRAIEDEEDRRHGRI